MYGLTRVSKEAEMLQLTCTALVIRTAIYDDAIAGTSISIIFDPSSKSTYVAFRCFNRDSFRHTLSRVRLLKDYAWHPLLLPSIHAEFNIGLKPQQIQEHKRLLVFLEGRTGIYKKFEQSLSSNLDTSLPWEKDTNFDMIPAQVASMKQDIAYLIFRSEEGVRLLQYLEHRNDVLVAKLMQLASQDTQTKSHSGIDSMKERLEFLRTFASNTTSRSKYLSERAEVLLQACHSLTTKKDSRNTQEMTKLSQFNAQATLEASKVTLEDSADMRTISAVTLFFLPATFVAVNRSPSDINPLRVALN
ncbi:hypothetical protein K469DRAFT_687312 [Zopfia rhizophila CBS 207.26]|uniref:Uncharacterized protein n=1 Tax=Zopfia rhizophila CBS 207.26 TaxID=1314779 RepID=A0A6A6E3E4_9PEZI|nr:hypothetical protein K469DRAFT_687312 [Zopfia rhizophila CBS 207.26]